MYTYGRNASAVVPSGGVPPATMRRYHVLVVVLMAPVISIRKRTVSASDGVAYPRNCPSRVHDEVVQSLRCGMLYGRYSIPRSSMAG